MVDRLVILSGVWERLYPESRQKEILESFVAQMDPEDKVEVVAVRRFSDGKKQKTQVIVVTGFCDLEENLRIRRVIHSQFDEICGNQPQTFGEVSLSVMNESDYKVEKKINPDYSVVSVIEVARLHVASR